MIDVVNDLVAALFCGAFIGMERELGKADGEVTAGVAKEARNLAGIRTHILVALLGTLLAVLDRHLQVTPWFAVTGFGATAFYATAAYGVRAARTGHYGMTSVPTLFLTYALGVLCVSGQRPLALASAVVITGLLAMKVPLHSFVRTLTRAELVAAVKFGLVTLVLLPLLPDRDYGPADWPWLADQLRGWGTADATLAGLALVNPYRLWLLVVVISGIGFGGYILVRLLGPRRGLVVTGLTGGLVSSTSTTLAMAQQSRRAPEWRHSFAAAVLAACAVMALRVLVLAVALGQGLLPILGPPLGVMLLTKLALAWWLARRSHDGKTGSPIAVATPLALWPALKLAGLIFLVRALSEISTLAIGSAGLIVTAVISGAADVDALTIAASQQTAAGRASAMFGALAIFTAVAVNTLTKGIMVLTAGDRGTGRITFVALLVALATGGAALLAVLAVRGFA